MAIIDKPTDYFDTLLYSGTGSSNAITGLDFQPDWVSIKKRSAAGSGNVYDSVRGALKHISTNLTAAEETESSGAGLTAFGSNGFTVGTEPTGNGSVNQSSQTYVGWCWKAGTSVSGTTTGAGTAKTYTGSVNTTSGFSIIKYTGNGTSGHTIPHNLTQKPAMIIVKKLTGDNWTVYHDKISSDPASDYIFLNSTAVAADYVGYWNDTEPTSSVFTVGNDGGTNANNVSLIAYCFAEKQGYSKFSSYVGNGSSSSGPFIFTGFKPAFLMIKATDAVKSWMLLDNKRNPSGLSGANTVDYRLRADTSEATSDNADGMDFLSNGFKPLNTDTSTNQSGTNYIYMAFAENPFVTSTGVPATAR